LSQVVEVQSSGFSATLTCVCVILTKQLKRCNNLHLAG